MAGQGGKRGEGESRGTMGVWGRAVQKNGGSSCKSKEEGRGAQGWECTLRVERRGRATKKGYTTLKTQHKKPKSGVDLGASICT